MSNEKIYGKHYSEYPDYITELVKQEILDEAVNLLDKILNIMESVAIEKGEGVAPWYYEKLSMIYKKLKNKDNEIQTLKRFLSQPKARGSKPRKLYEKYLKLNKDIDEEQIQKNIYIEYKRTIGSSALETTKSKCSYCGKKGEYIVPIDEKGNKIQLFGSCCPYCCTSDLVSL